MVDCVPCCVPSNFPHDRLRNLIDSRMHPNALAAEFRLSSNRISRMTPLFCTPYHSRSRITTSPLAVQWQTGASANAEVKRATAQQERQAINLFFFCELIASPVAHILLWTIFKQHSKYDFNHFAMQV